MDKEKIILIGGVAILVLYFLFKGSDSGGGQAVQQPAVIYPQYSNLAPQKGDNTFALANLQANLQKQAIAAKLFEDLLQYKLYLRGQDIANQANSGANQSAIAAQNAASFAAQDAYLQNIPFAT